MRAIHSKRFPLPKSEDFPPEAADKHPNPDIGDARDEPHLPPLADGEVAGAEEDRRLAGPVMSQRSHQAAEEAEGQRREFGRRSQGDRDDEEGRIHGADMGDAASEKVVGVKVDQADDDES